MEWLHEVMQKGVLSQVGTVQELPYLVQGLPELVQGRLVADMLLVLWPLGLLHQDIPQAQVCFSLPLPDNEVEHNLAVKDGQTSEKCSIPVWVQQHSSSATCCGEVLVIACFWANMARGSACIRALGLEITDRSDNVLDN
jgi:hypothetical protein